MRNACLLFIFRSIRILDLYSPLCCLVQMLAWLRLRAVASLMAWSLRLLLGTHGRITWQSWVEAKGQEVQTPLIQIEALSRTNGTGFNSARVFSGHWWHCLWFWPCYFLNPLRSTSSMKWTLLSTFRTRRTSDRCCAHTSHTPRLYINTHTHTLLLPVISLVWTMMFFFVVCGRVTKRRHVHQRQRSVQDQVRRRHFHSDPDNSDPRGEGSGPARSRQGKDQG